MARRRSRNERARSGLFEMDCLPGFARSRDGLAIAMTHRRRWWLR